MNLVSIIIPIYNAGDILIPTLESVAVQSYKEIEVILVDDGSTDQSAEICLKFTSRDSRFKYFKKENGGICSARNYGLNRCNGEFVFFSDHDDILDERLIEKAVCALKNDNADVVKFGVKLFDEEKNTTIVRTHRKSLVLSRTELIPRIVDDINNEYYSNIWDCLFTKNFLINNNLCFDESYTKGFEDIDFNFKMLPKIQKVVVITDVLYTHYKRINHSTSAKKNTIVLNCILQSSDRMNKLVEYYNQLQTNQIELTFFFLHSFLISYISYSKKIKKNKTEIITNVEAKHSNVFKHLSKVSLSQLFTYSYKKGGIKYLMLPFIYVLFKKKKLKLIYSLI